MKQALRSHRILRLLFWEAIIKCNLCCADLRFGDPWAPEPACYLTDDEIGLDAEKQAELARTGEVFQMPD